MCYVTRLRNRLFWSSPPSQHLGPELFISFEAFPILYTQWDLRLRPRFLFYSLIINIGSRKVSHKCCQSLGTVRIDCQRLVINRKTCLLIPENSSDMSVSGIDLRRQHPDWFEKDTLPFQWNRVNLALNTIAEFTRHFKWSTYAFPDLNWLWLPKTYEVFAHSLNVKSQFKKKQRSERSSAGIGQEPSPHPT